MNTCAASLIYTVRQQGGRFYRDPAGEWVIKWPRNTTKGLRELIAERHLEIIVQLDMERAYGREG